MLINLEIVTESRIISKTFELCFNRKTLKYRRCSSNQLFKVLNSANKLEVKKTINNNRMHPSSPKWWFIRF